MVMNELFVMASASSSISGLQNEYPHTLNNMIYYDLCYDVIPVIIYNMVWYLMKFDKIFGRKYNMVYDIEIWYKWDSETSFWACRRPAKKLVWVIYSSLQPSAQICPCLINSNTKSSFNVWRLVKLSAPVTTSAPLCCNCFSLFSSDCFNVFP